VNAICAARKPACTDSKFATVPEPVEFSPGDLPALEAASDRYVREEPSVDVRVTGTVTRLRGVT